MKKPSWYGNKKQVFWYDYKNQCWVVDGIIPSCEHPAEMNCHCYGKLHKGEQSDSTPIFENETDWSY